MQDMNVRQIPLTHDEPRPAPVPAVSVIVPAYNAAPYIGETLESVFAQTFTDYEVVVVNDGSPDTPDLERVLAPYREKIVYLTQENRGLSGARNTAIRAARGRYIALLDSDDLWEPEYLAVQVEMMEHNPETDVLYPNAMIFGEGLEAGQKFMDICPSEGEVTFERLITQQCHVMICVTARREAIIRAGLFDESLRSSEDYDLWGRIIKQGGRIAYHRRVLARYRRRLGSLTYDQPTMGASILRVLEKAEQNLDLTSAERAAVKWQRARVQARLAMHEGKNAFFRGEADIAVERLTKANEFFKSQKLVFTILLLRFAPGLLLRVYDMRDRFILKANTKL
jgi:glycosyltransferase involved in cell wall biosynthesis